MILFAMNSGERILLSLLQCEIKKRAAGKCFIFTGDLDAEGAACVLKAMESEVLEADLTVLDLEDLELLDGAAVAHMVALVRLLLIACKRVQVLKSPQSLAHTLYRVGMLEGDARLELIEPREEEGVSN